MKSLKLGIKVTFYAQNLFYAFALSKLLQTTGAVCYVIRKQIDAIKRMFVDENAWFSLKISQNFICMVGIKKNIPEVAQVMACRLIGSDNGLALARRQTSIWTNDG